MNRRKLLAFNTGSSLILQITTIICGFIVPRLILQTYGSEVNGLINSITQFLAIIAFLELGVGAVIQSSLYKPLANRDDKEISKIVVSGQKFFSRLAKILLVYVIILMGVYPLVAKSNFGFLYSATMILVISISSFAQYYFGIVNSLLITANQRGYFSFNIQTVTLVLNTIACFVLIKLGASIHIVKLTTSLIYLFRPLLLSLYVKKNYNIDWNVKYSGEPIKQKWNGIAQHVAAVILNGTDSIILTMFIGLSAVSIYSVYNMVTQGIRVLVVSMTGGMQSLMGELLAKEEFEKLKNIFGRVEWTVHTATILIFGVTLVLILPFVEIYTLGISDAEYIQPLFAFLMVVANAARCLRLPYNLMILAAGHYKQTQNNYVIAAILNIALSIMLVNTLGLVGVAIGTFIAMLYQTIWMAYYNSRNIIYWSLKLFIKQMSVDILMIILFIIAYMLLNIHVGSWISWILQAIIVTAIGTFMTLLINVIFYKSYIIKLIEKIKESIKSIL